MFFFVIFSYWWIVSDCAGFRFVWVLDFFKLVVYRGFYHGCCSECPYRNDHPSKFNLLKVCVKIQIKLAHLKFAIYWLSWYLVNWSDYDKILNREKIVLPIFPSMERIPAWKIYIQDSGLLSRLKQQPLTVMVII